jgi:hypothetical protein
MQRCLLAFKILAVNVRQELHTKFGQITIAIGIALRTDEENSNSVNYRFKLQLCISSKDVELFELRLRYPSDYTN